MNIVKEKGDLEKRASNSIRIILSKKSIILFTLIIGAFSYGQTESFVKGKTYELDSITVSGIKTFNEQTVISYSGLRKGQKIKVPGEEVSSVINKLWGLELFSNINVFVTNVENNKISLDIEIDELPTLTDVKINGLKKGNTETIIKDTELTKGKKLSESFLTNTKNYITNKYKKEGFLDTKVNLNTIKDTVGANSYKMVVNIDKGQRIKIKEIDFNGNEVFKESKLRSKLKNTKIKNPIRFWKRSKYINNDFNDDLNGLIEFYKENGFRDARIIKDTLLRNDKTSNSIALKLDIEEGKKYYFGDIDFIGNTVYSNSSLQQILGLKKGDVYNGVILIRNCL